MAVERQQGTSNRSDVPSIKDLIRAALDSGKTVRQLEADSGNRVRFQTFQELSNAAPDNFPRNVHQTITGMALALGVPETTIVLAYATSLGIPVAAGSPFSLRIPPGMEHLSPAVQESFLSLMRAVVRQSVESAEESSASAQGEAQKASDNVKPWLPTGRLGAIPAKRQSPRKRRPQ